MVAVAIGLVGIKGSGRGVIHRHARGNAHTGPGGFGPHGDAHDGRGEVGQKTQSAVFSFVARGQGGARSGRVGHAVGGREGINQTGIRKVGKGEWRDADASLKGCQIGLGEVDLVDAHTVADEIEHIFGLASGPQRED